MDRGGRWAMVHDVTELDMTEMTEHTVGSIHLMSGVQRELGRGQPVQAASSPVGLSPRGVCPEPLQAPWMPRPGCWFCWTRLVWPWPHLQPTTGLSPELCWCKWMGHRACLHSHPVQSIPEDPYLRPGQGRARRPFRSEGGP